MGYRTEQRMCSSCGGYGSYDRTVYVSNPNPTGPFSIPVTKRETCLTCGGMGTKNHSVYEPDPVPRYPVQEIKSPSRKEKNGKLFNPDEYALYEKDSEALKNAKVKFAAKIIALLSTLAFFFYTYNIFPTLTQGLIGSGVVFGAVFFTLSKPLRGLTLAITAVMHYVLKVISTLLVVECSPNFGPALC